MINPIFEIVNIAAAARIGGFHEITFRGKMHGVGKYRFGDEDIEGLNKVIASVRQAVDGYNDLIDIETSIQKIHGYEAILPPGSVSISPGEGVSRAPETA